MRNGKIKKKIHFNINNKIYLNFQIYWEFAPCAFWRVPPVRRFWGRSLSRGCSKKDFRRNVSFASDCKAWERNNVMKIMLWNLCYETYVMKLILWNLCYETYVMKLMLWNLCYETCVMKLILMLWNLCYETYVMRLMLWNLCYETYVMKLMIWNLCYMLWNLCF